MPQPARGGLRCARLGAVVAACLGLAAGGHALGGGGLPSASTLALTLPALGLVALWFTRRERSIPTLFAVLVGVEAALHAYFHLAAHGAPALNSGLDAALLTGHAGHGRAAAASQVSQVSHADPGHTLGLAGGGHAGQSLDSLSLLPSPSMAAAHLLAIALTALALGWGDRSIWAAARRLLPVLAAAPAVPRAVVAICCAAAPGRLRSLDLRYLAPVRGPPAEPRLA
ncbi:MAG: hypothetical protein IPK37_00500 [Austwickia sp.]|jgi:hypothetical protein|nr:MAG: hypothetical protein IPK37_00500 [Austwickia sp.]